MRLLHFLFIFLFLLPGAVLARDVVETRLWATPENTRLVLESDHPLDYVVQDSSSPPLLVVEIMLPEEAVVLLNDTDALDASEYIHTISSTLVEKESLRFEFNLTAAIRYNVDRILPINHYRHRLVIDLKPEIIVDPLKKLLDSLSLESFVLRPFLVVIDPGHGGEDPGAVSPNNNYEKDIVLDISKRLKSELDTRPGMKAVLTRDDDRFIPLARRVQIAHRLKADIFLSIHADSVASQKARGSSIFILSEKGASTSLARQLAKQANLSDLIGGAPSVLDSNLDFTLRELSKTGKKRGSEELAASVLENIKDVNQLHSKMVESAGFAVLKSPYIPSILIETAFISNPEEEKKLLDPQFRATIAKSIADALVKFKNRHHHE